MVLNGIICYGCVVVVYEGAMTRSRTAATRNRLGEDTDQELPASRDLPRTRGKEPNQILPSATMHPSMSADSDPSNDPEQSVLSTTSKQSHTSGCKCLKTKCETKKCSCKKAGKPCGNRCECAATGCVNTTPRDVASEYVPSSREIWASSHKNGKFC